MTVINRKTNPGAVNELYIGRGSMWGNPFVIRPHAPLGAEVPGARGQTLCGHPAIAVPDRETAVRAYAQLLAIAVEAGQISVARLASLHGKNLA